MRFPLSTLLLVAIPAAVACGQSSSVPPTAAKAASRSEASGIVWGPAPAVFPKGAQMAVLQGNPGGSELFTVRLRFPNGYRIPAHTHPTDEIVTVISGTFRVGMGERFQEAGMLTLPAGGFVVAPANHAHFAAARGETVVQVHAMGPFAMTYVNPADNPSASASR